MAVLDGRADADGASQWAGGELATVKVRARPTSVAGPDDQHARWQPR